MNPTDRKLLARLARTRAKHGDMYTVLMICGSSNRPAGRIAITRAIERVQSTAHNIDWASEGTGRHITALRFLSRPVTIHDARPGRAVCPPPCGYDPRTRNRFAAA